MQLSEHFTLEELIYSDTAKRYGINNTPPMVHEGALKHTCLYLLEPLRALLNVKYVGRLIGAKVITKVLIKITSGYRSEKLNTKVGGAKNSQHLSGEACDCEAVFIFTDGSKQVLNYMALFADIKQFCNDGLLAVDQCIQEKSGAAVWVHVSHHPSGKTLDRRQFLKYNNGKYTLDVDLP